MSKRLDIAALFISRTIHGETSLVPVHGIEENADYRRRILALGLLWADDLIALEIETRIPSAPSPIPTPSDGAPIRRW